MKHLEILTAFHVIMRHRGKIRAKARMTFLSLLFCQFPLSTLCTTTLNTYYDKHPELLVRCDRTIVEWHKTNATRGYLYTTQYTPQYIHFIRFSSQGEMASTKRTKTYLQCACAFHAQLPLYSWFCLGNSKHTTPLQTYYAMAHAYNGKIWPRSRTFTERNGKLCISGEFFFRRCCWCREVLFLSLALSLSFTPVISRDKNESRAVVEN